MDIFKIRDAYFKLRDTFMSFESVVGMGIGGIEKNGMITGELGIVVLVYEKKLKDKIKKDELISDAYEGIRIDVREPRLTAAEYRKFLQLNNLKENQFGENPDPSWINYAKLHRIVQHKRNSQVLMAPLSASDMPLIEVRGEIVIMEDRNLDTIFFSNHGADFWKIYQVFRTRFGDHYDFMFIYFDTASLIPGQGNHNNTIFNQIRGTAHPKGDNCTERDDPNWGWGSNKMLSHQWVSGETQIRRCLHETAHQWCAYVSHMENGQKRNSLHWRQVVPPDPNVSNLAPDHWGTCTDREKSCMGQKWEPWDWVNSLSGPGPFERAPLTYGSPDVDEFGFHPLDLYLMGFEDSSKVGPFRYIANSVEVDSTGTYKGNEGPLTIQNVTDLEDRRDPAYPDTQRVFHQACILVTKDMESIDQSSDVYSGLSALSHAEIYRKGTITRFREAVKGRAMIDGCLLHDNFENIFIRDNLSDTGAQNSTGCFWNSPDIWVRNNKDGLPDHQNPIRGQNNYIYVRIHNSSPTDYEDVTVRIYFAEALQTDFFYPEDWKPGNLIDEAVVTVPANGEKVIPFLWDASGIPEHGPHPCLLAEILPMEVTPVLRHNAQNNRKLAQKNLEIVEPQADVVTEEISFWFGHSTRTNEEFGLLTLYRSRDTRSLDLELDPDCTLQMSRDLHLLPGPEYTGMLTFSSFISRRVIPFFRRIFSAFLGENRFGDRLTSYERDGRLIYKLPNKKILSYKVPIEGQSVKKMKMFIQIGDTPPVFQKGLIRVIQSTMEGVVAGGIDITLGL